MNASERSREAANEAAIERQYSEGLVAKERRARQNKAFVVNNTWTDRSLASDPILGSELIGRVRLDDEQDLIDARDFYIGTDRFTGDDYEVYGWTAPVACTFYRKSSNHHDLCEHVEGVRVFAHRGGVLDDFQDERIDGGDAADLFTQRTAFQVPRAPGRPAVEIVPEEIAVTEVEIATSAEPRADDRTAASPMVTTPRKAAPGPTLRAERLLKRQLAAPKQAAMSAVLATLQSDQYEAITAPAAGSQILQGHPGTGKTIVAVHRAAYLLSPSETDDLEGSRARGRVLILGPTAEYVTHVSRALRSLIADDSRFRVLSVPALLEDLAGLTETSSPTETVSYQDVDSELARLVDKAFSRARDATGGLPDEVSTYAALIGFLKDPPGGVIDRDWFAYLRALPATYAELKRNRRRVHRGLMAYIGVRTSRPPQFGHVIVDEGQDIHPLEWEVLARLGNSGGWTILGDLNQRRTDHTFSSWDKVSDLLAIEDAHGRAPVQVLERGYRSTAQIIQFANQLLPREERELFSLQDNGVPPVIVKASTASAIYDSARAAAAELRVRVEQGSVAIIAADYERMRAQMVRAGWQTDRAGSSLWRHGTQEISVLPPERARGLEFDAVVVVEPAAFPERVGRQGVLYTAITRANRLLTVVHYRPLPERLRGRKR